MSFACSLHLQSHPQPRPAFSQRRQTQPSRARCRVCSVVSLSEAAEALQEGRKKYDAGDRMGALRLFESALKKDPSVEERQAALYDATCVHAGYGDVELAQQSLRDGVTAGLEFDAALKDPDRIKLDAPPQVQIQLKKFAITVKKVRAAVSPTAAAAVPAKAQGSKVSLSSFLDADMSTMLRTDITGMDTSIFGIVRRVGILLAVAVGGGALLFYLGLFLTFGGDKS
ncbi:hypothetical protein WJX73_003826 [Symbiochloris irregularis]|uniref:Uncharacterized protein n=1 Tax=Symbiochloris irregularis TaxID=706552 RepID=A0AAW1NZ79_9CHLO